MKKRGFVVPGLAVAVLLAIAPQARAGVVNGGFEAGFAGWATTDIPAPFYPLTIASLGSDNSFGWPWSSTPTEGTFAAYHGFDGDPTGSPGLIRIAQDLLIDAPTLEFDHRAAWDLTFGGVISREFRVNIEPFGGGGNLQTTLILSAVNGTTVLDTGPLSETVDVSAFLGLPVRVSFDWSVPEIFTGPAAAQLDNVRLTPEPATLSLLGLAGLAMLRRRRSARV